MFIHLFIYYCVSLSISFFIFVAWWCSMHAIVHVDIYSFLCSVSYNYITIILIIAALYYFCSITQKHIYIAMHYYFNKKIRLL